MKKQKKLKKCSFYPCHKVVEDCLFCYCPIYPCKLIKTGGFWLTINGRKKALWDCSNCILVHNEQFVKNIKTLFKNSIKQYCGE